jgi:hypothetical protein
MAEDFTLQLEGLGITPWIIGLLYLVSTCFVGEPSDGDLVGPFW